MARERGRTLHEQPEHGLRDADGPDRPVEYRPLVPFVLRRPLHARQQTERAKQPEAARDRKIRGVVDLPHPPLARRDRPDQPRDVQHREGDDRAPRERVADATVERIGTILGEPDDVRRRLHAGELPEQARRARRTEHDTEPGGHAPVEALREQVERERARRDEERPDPDRPVVQPVAGLVAGAELAFRVELDALGVADLDGVAGRHQIAEHCRAARRAALSVSAFMCRRIYFCCFTSAAIWGGGRRLSDRRDRSSRC